MNKNFYLGLIPVGSHCNWKETLENIGMSTILHDKAYKCKRYFDELESKKYIDDEPIFFPNENINLENDVKFRMAVSSPVYFSDDKRNNKLTNTPWRDEDVIYSEASWLSVNKMINNYSDYVLIVRFNHNRLGDCYKENTELVERVINICNKANKPYKIINDNEYLRYEDVYKYFLNK